MYTKQYMATTCTQMLATCFEIRSDILTTAAFQAAGCQQSQSLFAAAAHTCLLKSSACMKEANFVHCDKIPIAQRQFRAQAARILAT
jgi:hypothetical protein